MPHHGVTLIRPLTSPSDLDFKVMSRVYLGNGKL